MSDLKKITRRDWFRLRIPHQNKLLTGADESPDTNVLKTIEHPPNHDGLDLSLLPPMREAVLTSDQVSTLFSDIDQLATDILLMQRSTNSARPSASKAESSNKLELAKSALLTGQLQKIQIRYRWKESLWIDTLASQGGGYRLVRIAHALPARDC